MCPIKFDLILPILNRKIGDKIRIRNMKGDSMDALGIECSMKSNEPLNEHMKQQKQQKQNKQRSASLDPL